MNNLRHIPPTPRQRSQVKPSLLYDDGLSPILQNAIKMSIIAIEFASNKKYIKDMLKNIIENENENNIIEFDNYIKILYENSNELMIERINHFIKRLEDPDYLEYRISLLLQVIDKHLIVLY